MTTVEYLESRDDGVSNKKLDKAYAQLQGLLEALNSKELPEEIADTINADVEVLNAFLRQEEALVASGPEKKVLKELTKELQKVYTKTIKYVDKQLKIVPKNYYRNTWMALGMTIFGVPFGVAFSMALGNYAYIGLGLPIGMSMGVAYGTWLDKKAAVTGNQLRIEYNM